MAFRPSLLLALLTYLVLPASVTAQHYAVTELEQSDRGARYEFTFTWPSTMRAALDTAGATVLNQHALLALTGGLESASETFSMPHMGQLASAVVETSFDEVSLERESDADTLAALLSGPVAVAGWAGRSAGEVLGSVNVRTLAYDAERNVLRRYRRVVVDVQFPTSAAGGSVGSRLRVGTSNPHVPITRSALADGFIFKIPIRTDGIYQLDAAYLNRALDEFDLSVADVDPSTIRILGNGGKPLPALNAAPRPGDLLEVPVQVTGSGNSLSVVFYGQGPQGWEYDAGLQRWLHYTHPFSNDNFYFLKIDASRQGGRRVVEATDPGSPEAVIDQVTGRLIREFDEVMWSKDAGSGHTWLSLQVQGGQSLAILNGLRPPGLVDGDVEYRARAAIRSSRTQPRTRLFFESNGASLANTSALPVFNDERSPVASPTEISFESQAVATSGLTLSMRLENDGTSPSAAADWVRVFYPQALRAETGYLRFATPPEASGVVEFVLRDFTTTPTVWDVTEPGGVRGLAVTGGNGTYRVRLTLGEGQPREIVAFTSTAFRAPDAPRVVPNQNLHGITSNPDFIIVTPDTFRVYAEELADRRRREGLGVEVADIQHIYNEFSGGLPDMRAIRDFFKFLYDRGLAVDAPLRYALLFGDGHFNFRNLGSTPPELSNWIFPYETEESFDPVASYTSDDYFGFLDDEEGVWAYRRPSPTTPEERVDIGIGRFNVQTPAEARAVIEKIKVYEAPENRGAWRTRYTFVADDGHNGLAGNLESQPDLHTQNIDVVADQVQADYPILNQKKIYGISYPRVFLTTWRQPEVRRDLLAAINSGSLIVNYSGHGKEDALAQEQIFTLEDATSLTNQDRLPLVVTATCSFGRWDLADSQSGAEVLLTNPRGGAIALFTTVRLVFTSASTGSLNVGLNLALNRALMQRDEDGRPRRLGDVLRLTKNTPQGLDLNNRKFNLLGDPTLRIGLPEPRVAIERVNGQSLEGNPVPVRALDRVTIEGSVQHLDGSTDAGFSGAVHLTVFDAQRRIQIPPDQVSALRSGYYVAREDLIWRGEAQAQNGAFSATFVVPKDISYSNANGKISAYAVGEQQDGGGYTYNVVVGGSSDNPPDDSEGPSIALYLNDTTFVSGGLTNPRPELIVHLHDESGINTVGAGVGHELLLVMNGDEQRATNIGEYYQSAENSFQKGIVRFPLEVYLREQNREQLDPGPHSLEVRAWDVVNNSSVAAVDFYVAHSEELELRNVLNFPNPLSRDTRFIFEHNQLPGTPARVQIRVYSLSGRPIRTLDHEETLPAGVLPGGPIDVYWDGRDEDFDYVGTGVYLYKVRVEVNGGDETEVVERIEKLAVIR